MKTIGRIFAIGLFAIVLLTVYGFYIEPSGIRVKEYDIALGDGAARLPEPLRIAVIADLHAGAPYINEAKIDRIVALTNASHPDLILLPGDFVIQGVLGGSPIPIEITAAKLRGLSAPLGVYAVLGNHEQRTDPEHIAETIDAAGIPVLENRSLRIDTEGGPLYLVGLSDAWSTQPDIERALANVPPGTAALCFTHSPDVFPDLPSACALTVAGHTHGGQVWLPFIGRPVVPSHYGQRYAAGLIRENGKTLFVSTGIGTSILPVRFGVPPEISVLNVR